MGCGYTSDAALNGRHWCRDHFCQLARKLLEDARRDLPLLDDQDRRRLPAFLSEIISETTLLASRAKSLTEAQRSQLLGLSFAAADFYKRVQRSPRFARELPVEIITTDPQNQKREVTKTVDVSRKGACVQTTLFLKTGQEVRIVLLKVKREARARVAWSSAVQAAYRKVGLEILDAEDFWGLSEAEAIKLDAGKT